VKRVAASWAEFKPYAGRLARDAHTVEDPGQETFRWSCDSPPPVARSAGVECGCREYLQSDLVGTLDTFEALSDRDLAAGALNTVRATLD